MVAVITGGGSGIGLTMAKALAGAGAKQVFILGRRREVLEQAAASTQPAGVVVPIECDVESKESIRAAVAAVSERAAGGRINLLVANSGVTGPENRMSPASSSASVRELRQNLFDDVSMDDFTRTFHVNVTGAYFTMLGFLELLDAGNRKALEEEEEEDKKGGRDRDAGFGSVAAASSSGGGSGRGKVPPVQSQVIFTSSISAYSRSWLSAPAYAGSKAAIAHLTKHASTNLAQYGIRVNALAPGCRSPAHQIPV
ncbi:NAD(P)-binding protein [Xylariomycetidae sp. FL2044]|nr:NAD(P)-binding protein [Xylariomycetidae sp. FL2044]